MKKIMLIGSVGCGKTTLTQALKGEEPAYHKTQAIQFHSAIIDTPGEFIKHRNLFHALITTATEAELIVLLSSAIEEEQIFSPQFTTAFNKPCIGVVTKIDLATAEQIEKVKRQLILAGVQTIFPVSSTSKAGFAELKQFLNQEGMK